MACALDMRKNSANSVNRENLYLIPSNLSADRDATYLDMKHSTGFVLDVDKTPMKSSCRVLKTQNKTHVEDSQTFCYSKKLFALTVKQSVNSPDE